MTAQVPPGHDSTSSNVQVAVPTTAETFTAAAYVPVRTAPEIGAAKAGRARPRQSA